MTKRVVVLASGETERGAVPHLVRHLTKGGHHVARVRTPHFGSLTLDESIRLLAADWWMHNWDAANRADKYVILLDADSREPAEMVTTFRGALTPRIPSIDVPVLVAAAKWHLEAWFFADPVNLRKALGGQSLGSVDTTDPDAIERPKLCLQHLLGEVPYTSVIAARIAQGLDPVMVRRSASFVRFEGAVLNGASAASSEVQS